MKKLVSTLGTILHFIMQFLQSKIFLLIILQLLQVSVLIVLMVLLDQYVPYITAFFYVFSAIVMAWLLARTEKHPSYKLMWTVFILINPFLGGMVYLLVGASGYSKNTFNHRVQPYLNIKEVLDQSAEVIEKLDERDSDAVLQTRYVYNVSRSPVQERTQTEYYPSGEEFFVKFIEDLKSAERYIFLEFFIINPGVMLNTVLDILEEKAKQGVEVCFLYDDVGSAWYVSASFPNKMLKRGITCIPYSAKGMKPGFVLNNRDHRKAVVIDGRVAYTGGCNLSDEYINYVERFGYWKDVMIRLEGDAVYTMALDFIQIWDFSNQSLTTNLHRFLPLPEEQEQFVSDGFVQPYSDISPLSSEPLGRNIYLNAIQDAKQCIYIMTPYLILDDETRSSLCICSKMGIDVRIIVPGIPDKKMVYQITQANYDELIKAGVRIYEYSPGFMHAKTVLIDTRFAVVGSCNFDFRSFFLHHECGVWIHGSSAVQQVKDDFQHTLTHCYEVTQEDLDKVPLGVRFLRMLFSVFAPLL